MTCGGVAKPYNQFGPRPTHCQASAHSAAHATPVGAWPCQVTFGGVSKPHSWFEPRPLCRFFPVHSAAHAKAARAWLGDHTCWVVSTSPTKWARPWARQQAGTCHQLSAAPPTPTRRWAWPCCREWAWRNNQNLRGRRHAHILQDGGDRIGQSWDKINGDTFADFPPLYLRSGRCCVGETWPSQWGRCDLSPARVGDA